MQEDKNIAIGTLYDMNKTIVKQNEIQITENLLKSKKEIIKNFISKTCNNYYMLLCNEKKDYTVFNLKEKSKKEKIYEMVDILVDECLKNRGEVRGIDLTKTQDAIEIWILIEEEAFVYYFFPYDLGIVEVGE